MDVPPDLAAALAEDAKANAAFDALKGSERYSVLYRLHQVHGAEKRRMVMERVVAEVTESQDS